MEVGGQRSFDFVTADVHPRFSIDQYIESVNDHVFSKFGEENYIIVIDVQPLIDAGKLSEVERVYEQFSSELPNIIWIPPRIA